MLASATQSLIGVADQFDGDARSDPAILRNLDACAGCDRLFPLATSHGWQLACSDVSGCTNSRPRLWQHRVALLRHGCPAGKWAAGESPLAAIEQTHLLYHVCPLEKSRDGWRWNVRQLVRRWGAFTGRCIVAVSTGPGCEPPAAVESEFPPGVEWLLVPNDTRLREVATFEPLLESISRESGAFFYAHTKGISTAGNRDGAQRWTEMMYRALLDDPAAVRRHLETYPCVGTTQMAWLPTDRSPYPSRLRYGNWMFAGTFFWARTDEIFRRNWRDIPADRYGAEAWLSGLFPHFRWGLSLYQPWEPDDRRHPSPYDPHWYPPCES